MRFALRPELRREQPRQEIDSGVPEKHPGDVDSPDRTNLDPVDISIDSSESESTSESDSLEFCFQRAHCSLDSARIGLGVQDIHLVLKGPPRFMVLIRRILTAGWTK